MEKTRWGLLGAGVLLERWMKGFQQVESGFPVLVEKPGSVTAADWAQMTACTMESCAGL